MIAGIEGYGVFLPEHRLGIDKIWDMWFHPLHPESVKRFLGVEERSVNTWEEDPVTMAVDASKDALQMSNLSPKEVGAVYLGTGTDPYVTKGAVSTVCEALGTDSNVMCADVQFSGKSGTASIQICAALVKANMAKHCLAIGSDSLSRHVAPNDWPLEYVASAGATAFVLGQNNPLAHIEDTYSYVTDTPEFCRLDGDRYIRRGVALEEESIGYEEHVRESVRGLMEKMEFKPKDFDHVVFHQPDGNRPLVLCKEIGFSVKQIETGLIAPRIGDLGCASALAGLAAVFDKAKPNERVLVASYGWGAGSDALSCVVTDEIYDRRDNRRTSRSVDMQIRRRTMVDYKSYLRMERKLIQEYL